MGVVLDTSVLIAAERGRLDMAALLAAAGEEPVVLAAVVASELLHGVERATAGEIKERRHAYVEWVLTIVPVVPFGLEEARVHARLWAHLAAKGQMIGPHDMLIAATALAAGFRLATLNRKEFKRVPGLVLVDLPPTSAVAGTRPVP